MTYELKGERGERRFSTEACPKRGEIHGGAEAGCERIMINHLSVCDVRPKATIPVMHALVLFWFWAECNCTCAHALERMQ